MIVTNERGAKADQNKQATLVNQWVAEEPVHAMALCSKAAPAQKEADADCGRPLKEVKKRASTKHRVQVSCRKMSASSPELTMLMTVFFISVHWAFYSSYLQVLMMKHFFVVAVSTHSSSWFCEDIAHCLMFVSTF